MSLKPYPKYKDSGVAWLGDVPEHWDVKPLKSVATLNDESLTETTESDFSLKYIDIGSVSLDKGIEKIEEMDFKSAPSRARRIVRHGDVIVSTVRTYLKAIAPITNPEDNLIVSTGFAVVRSGKSIQSDFTKYVLQSGEFVEEVIARSTGVSYPAINSTDLARIKLCIPNDDEQTTIANFLDHETHKIDALIAEQEKLITLLAEKRQATISHAVTKGLNPRASMKDSGVEWLGEVPAHWRTCALKHFCDIRDGTHDTPKFVAESEDSFPFITSKDLSNGKIDFSDTKFISLDDYLEVSKRSAVVLNDVLMPMIGSIGGAVVVNETRSFAIKNVALFKNSKKLDSFWLSCLLDSNASTMQFDLSRSGGVQGFVGLNTLRNLFFAFPPPDEQYKIGLFLKKRLEEFSYLILEAENIISVLKERRTALISAAVTGKIDVRGWRA